METIDNKAILQALETVIDPEIRRPITELGMVREVVYKENNTVEIHIDLTVATCPLKDTIKADTIKAVSAVENVSKVEVVMGVMSAEQRKALREKLSGTVESEIPFTKVGNTTKIYAISSGKGGVGKSSITANLAVALAQKGLKVGVMDADIYGFSIPRMLGVDHEPTTVDSMIIPPIAKGVKVISIGMFVSPSQAVVWRGPMLHRALQQFLGDVFWGDIDILLIDLPPGTGDIAISIAQLLPHSELIVVTTPQIAAAEVSGRTGAIGLQTKQRVVGVIENMSYLIDTAGVKIDLFGKGGGKHVSKQLTELLGYEVPLLAQIPLDINLRIASDKGEPIVFDAENNSTSNDLNTHQVQTTQEEESKVISELKKVANKLAEKKRGLAGMSLGVSIK
ncbi:Mrp/NBP35 family ATP-binding protein [Actinomyces sp. zg-332]|uniref:Mrp/NBP35 family ATP-binding protein n=1 Tax=Actinomyces sp. zg-332 TaxID=2708340 RepID=UPI0014203681|nr:Mrp/NBP35 family ATP-binding protein [Actinomyces sp. zg-332]QPK94335.1 Mrp/NBP35 family ATP-binding protein [Actinomyces sp. zg-332]